MASDEGPKNTSAAKGENSGFPTFIRRVAEGVFVDPSKMTVENAFRVFVERLFSQGARFSGLDYAKFQTLLFALEPSQAIPFGGIKVAQEIVVFPVQRQALYKSIKLIDGGRAAEYLFEPAFLELSDPGRLPGEAARTRLEATQLDIDEFIAAMWLKSLCFGIDVAAVSRAIAAGKVERVTVATERAPTPAQDATLHEEWSGLHRDDSPLIRDGMADLRSHKNRFPQIRAAQRMLKKIPAQPGVPGFKVTGQRVDPEPPKDIDLKAMSGPGTRIENLAGGEFLISVWDGFLVFNPGSTQISVTEKIDDAGGVSAKTTGNLRLSVDEFVERGEVQEGCSVEGRHMKFMAAVYGSVISHAGRIDILDSLSGGSASSPGGSVSVSKRASNARIEAPGGSIQIKLAENCTVIGEKVTIGHAVNCDILADSVRIETALGCSVAARSIEIVSAGAKNERQTIASVLVQNTASFLRSIAALNKHITELRALADSSGAEIDGIEREPEFAKFKALGEMLRQGSVKFTPAQEQSYRVVRTKHAPAVRSLEKLTEERDTLLKSSDVKQQEVLALVQEQASLAAGRRLRIHAMSEETLAQQLSDENQGAWSKLARNELARALSAFAGPALRIASYQGGVDWTYELDPLVIA